MSKIENKIKKDANNASFEFKEEYWAQTLVKLKYAERMLIVKRLFWTLGSIGIVIGFVIYFGLIPNDMDTPSINQYLDSESMLASNESSVIPHSTSLSSSTEKLINTKTETKVDQKIKEESNLLITHKSSIITDLTFKTNPVINEDIPAKLAKNGTKSFDNQIKTKINSPVYSMDLKQSKENNTVNNESKKAGFIDVNESESKEVQSAQNLKTNKSESIIKEAISPEKKKETEKKVSSLLPEKIQEIIDTPQDSASSPLKKEVKIAKSPFQSTFSIQGYIGGIFTQEFTNHKKINNSFPYFGLDLNYKFSQPISISLGLGLYRLNMRSNSVEYTFNEYNFGLNQTKAVFTLASSTWLEIPFKVHFDLSQGHFIGIGGAYSYNLLAKNNVSTNLSFTNEQEINASNQIAKDYENYRGFYQNTFSTFMSYRYMVKRFGGEIKYHIGLNDMLNNEKMKSVSFERSNRLTVTLVYSIF